jgi:transposase-like protein
MNVHSLAKTTPLCRWTIVKRVMILQEPVATVARDNSISSRTVFKWLRRFRCEGFLGLFDRSSRPHRSPQRLPQYLILYIRWRRFKEQTAAAIAETINCARSTVARWIRLLGFCMLSERKPAEAVQRYEHQQPGDLLHLDIKRLARIERPGKRVTGDPRQRSRGGGYEQLHVCIDDNSRVAYEEILPDAKGATAAAFLERCVAFFASCSVTVKRVLTDNGPCYHSRKFKHACRRLGIRNGYTRPYRPQTNGKAERFIRTTLNEWAWPTRFESSQHRKQDLRRWLVHYNLKRKHSALGHRPPASRLETVNNVLRNYN